RSLPQSIRPPLQSRQVELDGTRVTFISLNAASSPTCSGEMTSRSHLIWVDNMLFDLIAV
ncbi:MAG: hypothetical protein QMD10_12930, partial [Desulfitobacteriaceae bacterium]|nr:hypothetical protein [Desulfitobacteriaceae bacterium]